MYSRQSARQRPRRRAQRSWNWACWNRPKTEQVPAKSTRGTYMSLTNNIEDTKQDNTRPERTLEELNKYPTSTLQVPYNTNPLQVRYNYLTSILQECYNNLTSTLLLDYTNPITCQHFHYHFTITILHLHHPQILPIHNLHTCL